MAKKHRKKRIEPTIKSTLKLTPSAPTPEKTQMHYDEIEYIRALLATIPNLSEVSRITGRNRNTILRIKRLSQDEISEYRTFKTKEFVKKAWEKIELLIKAINDGKCAFASVNQLTTAIGTLYDKAALASGDVTNRTEHKISDIDLSKLSLEEKLKLREFMLKINGNATTDTDN